MSPPDDVDPVPDDPAALAREFMVAALRHDWDRVRELTTDDFRAGATDMHPNIDQFVESFGGWEATAELLAHHFHPVENTGDLETLIESYENYYATFGFSDIEVLEMTVVDGDRVAYRADLTLTHDEMYYGYEPTGESAVQSVMGVIRVEDGLVADRRRTYNRIDFFVDLGILPGSGTVAKVHEQFDAVVNRVLRHNLRNDLSTVGGYADLIAEDGEAGETAAGFGRDIRATVDDLLSTVETVRRVERTVLNPTGSHVVPLDTVVADVVESRRADRPGVTIEFEAPAEPISLTSNEDMLVLAVDQAIENAVEHGTDDGGRVTVRLGRVLGDPDHAATVEVIDRGPGIPEHEVAPLSAERESDLAHTSGIGLWAIKWSAERLGGGVEYVDRDGGGTMVRVLVPDMRLEDVH